MINLMQGDCLERMKEIPDGSVDAVICDPPYGMDFQSQWKKEKSDWRPKIANDKRPYIWWLLEASKKLKDGGCLISFCRWDSWHDFSYATELAGVKVKGQIVWDKKTHGTGDLKGAAGLRHELAIFGVKGRFLFHGKRPQSLFSSARISPAKLTHPNEKPLDLMSWLVEHYCPEGGTVLDPFMGSAPVGVAAKNLNRKFIGIELDQGYFNLAKNRIEVA